MRQRNFSFLDRIIGCGAHVAEFVGIIYPISEIVSRRLKWWDILIGVLLYTLGRRISSFYPRRQTFTYRHWEYWSKAHDRYNLFQDLWMRFR